MLRFSNMEIDRLFLGLSLILDMLIYDSQYNFIWLRHVKILESRYLFICYER